MYLINYKVCLGSTGEVLLKIAKLSDIGFYAKPGLSREDHCDRKLE